MISLGDFVNLGISVEEGLSRIASDFHVKDDNHDGWVGAAEDAREKVDEVRSLLKFPELAETLANARALSEKSAFAQAPTFDQQRAQFESIYRNLAPTIADALKAIWIGDWEINDDGVIATLKILQWQAAGAEPGRDLKVEYTGGSGVTSKGWVGKFDTRWHHLHFFVSFGATSRYFDAYLFKWDKCRLAGISEGRGFSAVKVCGLGTDRA